MTHEFRPSDIVISSKEFLPLICTGFLRIHDKYYIRSNMLNSHVAQMKLTADVWHRLRVLTQVHYLIVRRTMAVNQKPK